MMRYLFSILLALIVAATFLWDWRRSGRMFCHPLPRPFRDRKSQESTWRQAYPVKMSMADALLTTMCEAFNFNPDHRYRFAPTDRLMDVYRASYLRWKFWKIGDNMEIESLRIELRKQFAVEVESCLTDITLGEIVGMMQSLVEESLVQDHERQ